jgi:hypothetical protein
MVTMHHAITTTLAISLAGAMAIFATPPAQARSNTAVVRIGKRPADATGYFFYPGNAYDDFYVYDPPAARRLIGYSARPSRHRHRHM